MTQLLTIKFYRQIRYIFVLSKIVTLTPPFLHSVIARMKTLNSADAGKLLVREFPLTSPDYGYVFDLLRHRSREKHDQIKLFEYYMQNIPFANAKPYKAFAEIMSFHTYIKVLRKVVPTSESDRQLFFYHVMPVFKEHYTASMNDDEVRSLLSQST